MHTFILSAVLLVWIVAKSTVDGALSISYSGSADEDSTTYSLKCEISAFSAQATWSRNSVLMTTCFSSTCLTTSNPLYTFRYDASGIYVDFSTLAENEDDITWTCEHTGDTPVNFTVEIYFTLSILVFVVSKIILVITGSGILGVLTAVTFVLRLMRYRKRKSLNHVKCIHSHIGDQVKVSCSHPFENITSDSNIVIRYENGQVSFNIQAVTETHYRVHKFEIPIEHTGMLKDVAFEKKVVKMDPLKVAPLPVTYKEIRMEFHFEVNHEEIHPIREPRRYIFAEEYNLRGVTFVGIQIICVAAIYQLISLITTTGVLLALYYGYGKYDTKVVISVSFAFAVLFAFIGTIVYVLTVTCCRKQKDKKNKVENVDEDQSRCCKTILLFVIIIFPAAWLLLIVMWIVNKCRQFPDERNQNNTVEMQSSDDRKDNNITVSH